MRQQITRIALLAVVLLATLASSAAVKIDGIYYQLYSTTANVTNSKDGSSSYFPKDYSGDVVIPKEVTYEGTTYTVTVIDNYAFEYCTGLTSVTFPETLTSIGWHAFEYCTGLTSVTFPESLTTIGGYAFRGCTSLRNLEFHCNSISLGDGAFLYCGFFDSVLFDCKSITSDYVMEYVNGHDYYYDPFGGRSVFPNIKTMIMGPGLLSIKRKYDNKYGYIHAVKTIWLGNTPPTGAGLVSSNRNYVSNEAFGFENQTVYPFLSSRFAVGGVVYVPVNPSERTCDVIDCSYDPAATDIVIADKVTNRGIELTVGEINPYSFYRNTYITSLQYTNDESISDYAFAYCSNLTSVNVHNKGNIVKNAFYGSATEGAAKFTIETGEIGESAFSGCSAITEAGIKATSIGYKAFYESATKKAAKFTIETGEIGESAFQGCSAITDAGIKATSIGKNAFYGSATKKAAKFTIETGEIGESAFQGCSAITEAGIKATSIGYEAFYESATKEAAKFTIETGEIGQSAFSKCSALESATLAEGLTSIGYRAFEESGLKSVVLPNSVTALGSYAFYKCSALESVSIGKGISALNGSTFSHCSSLPAITIPANVTSVGNYVFDGCSSLAKVNIDDREAELSLGSNGSSPLFASCPLGEVYIGGDISYPTESSNGYSPFYRNTSLRSVKITDKETEISPNEFYGCTNLQEVVIGDGVETIGNYAFSGCSSLKSFAFGSKVQTIGEEAFSDCTAMTSLTSHNPVPPTCGTQALDDINKWDCTLYVPKASIDTYKAAPQWKEFFFYGEAPLGIDDINGELPGGIEIETVGGNALRIGGADGCGVEVYGVDGRCEWRTDGYDGSAVELAPGVHIVRVGGSSAKVML